MDPDEDRSEIAFFDVETTVPIRSGQRFAILEFGAILVCPKKLVELENYSALVRPSDLRLISSLSVRCNGITPDAVSAAPTFAEIADRVYDILHGRIWAGHNILRFDCARIREAFAEIGKPAPEPKGIIDSLALLTQRFGRRAGDMKMATLATYFGLGQQTHRSLDDVRMNLEVLKYCATVLFLESSLPEIFTENSWVSPNAITRSHTIGKSPGKSSSRAANLNRTNHTISLNLDSAPLSSPLDQIGTENHHILSLVTRSSEGEGSNLVESNTTQSNPFEMHTLIDKINSELPRTDISMEENNNSVSTETATAASISQESSGPIGFIDPDEVSVSSISACHVQHFHGYQRIKLLHRDISLQIFCSRLKVRFGISTKFVDNAGRPRLSFVVNALPSLCRVLDACDVVAQRLFLDSISTSEWRPVVTRKNGFFNYPTVRLQIPTIVCGEMAIYATEIYQKESSSTPERLTFSKFDAAELDTLFTPGTFVDAFFSLDTYDYQQNSGIRLVAKKLIIHSQ